MLLRRLRMDGKCWGDHTRSRWLLCVATTLCPPAAALAEPVDFRQEVWPILQARCIACHGPDKQKSSLRVDTRSGLVKGGDSGPALVPGEPTKSYLLELVSAKAGDLRMPPEGEALSATQIDTLRRWIADGATWPADFAPASTAAKHWAFQPVARPAVPEISDPQFISLNPIGAR